MWKFKDKSVMDEYVLKISADKIGLHPDTLRKVVNGTQSCSKLVAYCITKYINSNAEIEDFFEKVE